MVIFFTFADSLEITSYLFRKGIKGVLAEWLGSGLQNHLQRFESARRLKNLQVYAWRFFLCLKFYENLIKPDRISLSS